VASNSRKAHRSGRLRAALLKNLPPQQAASTAGGTQHGYGEKHLTRPLNQAAMGPMTATRQRRRAESAIAWQPPPLPFVPAAVINASRPHPIRSQCRDPSLRRFQGLPAPLAFPGRPGVVAHRGWSSRAGESGFLYLIPGCAGANHLPGNWASTTAVADSLVGASSSFSKPKTPEQGHSRFYIKLTGRFRSPRVGHLHTMQQVAPNVVTICYGLAASMGPFPADR